MDKNGLELHIAESSPEVHPPRNRKKQGKVKPGAKDASASGGPPKKKKGTWAQLVRVAPNLYRHPKNEMYYGWKKVDGRAQLHCLETADRQTADRKLAEWLSDIRRVNPTVARSTLEELLQAFVATRANCKGATKNAENGFLKSFRAHFDCERRVSSVKPSEIKAFATTLATKREYSNSTFNRLCVFLCQVFELAKSDSMTAENLYTLSGLKYRTVHRPPPQIPTVEQFEKILANVRSIKNNRKAMVSADFLEFEGRAGFGQAEASAMRWKDIDFSAGPYGEMRLMRVKTGKYFQVPIYPKLRPLLERMKEEAIAHVGKNSSKFDENQRVFMIDNARKALTNACERMELPPFTQRNLRQMFILEAYRAGVDVKTIAKWQGHQDGGKLIMDTYTEVFGADQKDFEKRQLAKLQ